MGERRTLSELDLMLPAFLRRMAYAELISNKPKNISEYFKNSEIFF